jgi:hypothetical protein
VHLLPGPTHGGIGDLGRTLGYELTGHQRLVDNERDDLG